MQCRNPGMTRADYERVFADYLGVKKVLWLNRGIAGDDTHGHVDDLARFVGPRRVVTVVEANPADENYAPLQENLERLRGMTDVDGRKLEVVPLPMPGPSCSTASGCRRATPTSTSPTASCWCRRSTTRTTAWRWACWPSCSRIARWSASTAVDLVWGLGTLHCMTQQEPSAKV